MRVLFVHNNFPGQYARLVKHLKGRLDIDMLSGSLATNNQPASIKRIGYKPHRDAGEKTHYALKYTEEAVIRGQAVYQAFLPVKRTGWVPDIILAHSGFGDGLFVKDLWPDAKYMPYIEWYYHGRSEENSFFPRNSPRTAEEDLAVRMKNTAILHDLAAMDWGQCPTEYQKSQIPAIFHDRISVLHDGVDTDYFSPDETATFTVGERAFHRGSPLVTYIARGMEPYRGFPQFIEAISILQRTNADVHVIVIGEDKPFYGKKREDGKTHKEWALETYPLDLSRVHFLGRQPLSVLQNVLRVSAAHVYLTAPFFLSWSMMEAMGAGALIVGSDTEPVREVITDGENGLLVPFFEPAVLAETLDKAISNPQLYQPLRDKARALIVEKYDMRNLTKSYVDLIEKVANGK